MASSRFFDFEIEEGGTLLRTAAGDGRGDHVSALALGFGTMIFGRLPLWRETKGGACLPFGETSMVLVKGRVFGPARKTGGTGFDFFYEEGTGVDFS